MKWDVLKYDINIRIRKMLLLYRRISIDLYVQKMLFRNEHILIILKPQIVYSNYLYHFFKSSDENQP